MAKVAQEVERRGGRRRTRAGIVDCDVHTAFRTPDAIKEYLPAKWHVYRDLAAVAPSAGLTIGAQARPSLFRVDSYPEDGVPGSDLALMREQLLDRYDLRAAILHPITEVIRFEQHGELGLALATATNDWMAAEWLSADDRLYGAITIPIEDAVLGAREVERVAANPRFVKVLMTSLTREPLGHSKYWPLYEVAAAHDLPVAVHVAGFSGVQSSSGWPTFFAELHTNYVLAYSAQTTSLVYSGVFDRFPTLRFVFEEGGLAWLPPLMWRLDRAWEEMREQVPHLEERPSDVIRRHFAVATQPLDEPERPEYLGQLLDQVGMDDRIMFSSDYPHHDFDDPSRVLPAREIGAKRREKIMSANAAAFFRL
jgi:uncharacterized protein